MGFDKVRESFDFLKNALESSAHFHQSEGDRIFGLVLFRVRDLLKGNPRLGRRDTLDLSDLFDDIEALVGVVGS